MKVVFINVYKYKFYNTPLKIHMSWIMLLKCKNIFLNSVSYITIQIELKHSDFNLMT